MEYRSKLIFRDNRWMIVDISSLAKWKEMTQHIPDMKINIKFEKSIIQYLPLHPNPELYQGVDPIPYTREASLSNIMDNKDIFVNYKVVNDSSIKMMNWDRIDYAVILR